MRNPILILALVGMTSPAFSQDLIVQFADGAPTGQLLLEANGCDISNAMVMLDLEGSAGRLIFETAPDDTRQPVEITSGYAALSPVRNGDQRLQILVQTLPSGESLLLSAGLNDTTTGDAHVAAHAAGMVGASVRVALSDRVVTGTFDTAGMARLSFPADASICMAAAN